jgi:hypothetical protein
MNNNGKCIDVYCRSTFDGEWEWAWDFFDYDTAIAYKKLLKRRGYKHVSIECRVVGSLPLYQTVSRLPVSL